MAGKADKLTPKQAAFVREYVKDWNGTQAAIRAGYSKRCARVQASQNLANTNIKRAVENWTASQQKRTQRALDDQDITQEAITRGLYAEATGTACDKDGNVLDSTPGARVAAWTTLARAKAMLTDKLKADVDVTRKQSDAELDAGIVGILAKIGQGAATPASDGETQAPTPTQDQHVLPGHGAAPSRTVH